MIAWLNCKIEELEQRILSMCPAGMFFLPFSLPVEPCPEFVCRGAYQRASRLPSRNDHGAPTAQFEIFRPSLIHVLGVV